MRYLFLEARAFFVAGGRVEERLVSLGPEVGASVGIERGTASETWS